MPAASVRASTTWSAIWAPSRSRPPPSTWSSPSTCSSTWTTTPRRSPPPPPPPPAGGGGPPPPPPPARCPPFVPAASGGEVRAPVRSALTPGRRSVVGPLRHEGGPADAGAARRPERPPARARRPAAGAQDDRARELHELPALAPPGVRDPGGLRDAGGDAARGAGRGHRARAARAPQRPGEHPPLLRGEFPLRAHQALVRRRRDLLLGLPRGAGPAQHLLHPGGAATPHDRLRGGRRAHVRDAAPHARRAAVSVAAGRADPLPPPGAR